MAATPGYKEQIEALAPDYDARHIEAFMRLEHSTLDGLSKEQFEKEVAVAVVCIEEGGRDMAERTARSYGL